MLEVLVKEIPCVGPTVIPDCKGDENPLNTIDGPVYTVELLLFILELIVLMLVWVQTCSIWRVSPFLLLINH